MAVGDSNLSSCNVNGSINLTFNKEFDLNTPAETLSLSWSTVLSDGTGAAAGDQVWHDQRTLSSGASETLDVYGTLTNVFGDTVNFASVRVIAIRNRSTASTLVVGGAAANAWATMFADSSDRLVLRPAASSTVYSWVILAGSDSTGYAVTSGTADQLKLAHGGEDSASLTYDIVLIGESA